MVEAERHRQKGVNELTRHSNAEKRTGRIARDWLLTIVPIRGKKAVRFGARG